MPHGGDARTHRGKWKLLLLYKLGENGVMRFNAIGRLHPRLSQKTLAQQLRGLESDSLVNRTSYNLVPPKVECSLTERGKAILPILDDMCAWGKDYLKEDYRRARSSAKARDQ